MPRPPVFKTRRLLLRAAQASDAPEIERLAGAREVAATTLNIPHPYPAGAAESWIARQAQGWEDGTDAGFAIFEGEGEALVGGIGLRVVAGHRRAELGYWIAVPCWNRGYCTEAADEMLRYGFEELALHRIHASHFGNNPASGRVMEKIGMSHEGRRREHVLKWGEFLDLEEYAVLAEQWRARSKESSR
jgi:RimJ/RimL family protein N-acetyltransferase